MKLSELCSILLTMVTENRERCEDMDRFGCSEGMGVANNAHNRLYLLTIQVAGYTTASLRQEITARTSSLWLYKSPLHEALCGAEEYEEAALERYARRYPEAA